MDAGLLGGLIGIGVMAVVVLGGTFYEKCKRYRCRRKHSPLTSHTPLLASQNPQQDLVRVVQRQKSHTKIATFIPKPAIIQLITITRQTIS